MAVLAAYFDESGTHQESPVVVVAGFLASKNRWERLINEWLRATTAEKIRGFHATDLEAGQGEFQGWNESRKERFLRRLGRIIAANAQLLIGHAVERHVFDKVVREQEATHLVGSAYAFCSFQCLNGISWWAKQSVRREPIAVWFERGNPLFTNQAMELWEKAVKSGQLRQAHRIGTVARDTKQNLRQFETADLAAYWTFRHARAQLCHTTEPYKECLTPIWKMRKIGGLYSRKNIEKWIELFKRWLGNLPS